MVDIVTEGGDEKREDLQIIEILRHVSTLNRITPHRNLSLAVGLQVCTVSQKSSRNARQSPACSPPGITVSPLANSSETSPIDAVLPPIERS